MSIPNPGSCFSYIQGKKAPDPGPATLLTDRRSWTKFYWNKTGGSGFVKNNTDPDLRSEVTEPKKIFLKMQEKDACIEKQE